MVTWDDVAADIPAHEINKHFSLMSCVNAEGESVEPLMMIQGARLLECYAKGWPECNICMSESGYMTKEAFYSWGIKWEEKTRPPPGPDGKWRPRLLMFDGHFSHKVVDLMKYLREHNVRVLTVHPHTTHLTCVLDNGPFKRFNEVLKHEAGMLGAPINKHNIMGMCKKAWDGCLEFKVDQSTKRRYNSITSGFLRTGLFPYNRERMEGWNLTVSEHYKEEKDKAGGGGAAQPQRPLLTLTAADKDKLRKDVLHVDKALPASTAQAIAKAPRTEMAEILTSTEWMERFAVKETTADDAAKAATAKKESKAQLKAARGGRNKSEWGKLVKAVEKAEKKGLAMPQDAALVFAERAANAHTAAPPAAPAPPAPAAAAAGGRKRKQATPAAAAAVEEEEEEEEIQGRTSRNTRPRRADVVY